MRRTNLLGLASRVVSGVGLLLVAGALPWLSRHDPAAAILRARYAELEPTEQALAAIREQLGLDQGPIAMSLQWWSAVLRGDLGNSWVSGTEIGPGLWQAVGVSATLTMFAVVVALNTWAEFEHDPGRLPDIEREKREGSLHRPAGMCAVD